MKKNLLLAMIVIAAILGGSGCKKAQTGSGMDAVASGTTAVDTTPLETLFKNPDPDIQAKVDHAVADLKARKFVAGYNDTKELLSQRLDDDQRATINKVLEDIRQAMSH